MYSPGLHHLCRLDMRGFDFFDLVFRDLRDFSVLLLNSFLLDRLFLTLDFFFLPPP